MDGDVRDMSGHETGVNGSPAALSGTGGGSPRDNGLSAELREPAGLREPAEPPEAEHGRNEFDVTAIVVDPQLSGAIRYELRGPHVPVLRGTMPAKPAVAVRAPDLVRFRDPCPPVPDPPRSQIPAAITGTIAGVVFVASIVAGLEVSATMFAVFAAIALAIAGFAIAAWHAAREGRPAIAAGFIQLPEATDLTEYQLTYAGALFHRRYVRPDVDLDEEALTFWRRAVNAANRIYRSESMRDEVIDTERVAIEVPELLWRIAEGLAMISDARFDLRRIAPGPDRLLHPAVRAKVEDQERLLARGTAMVNRRIGRLEVLATRLDAADAARQGEAVLRELLSVDPKIREVLASTDENAGDSELAASVQLDVESVIAMANQAIRELSVTEEHAVADPPA
jgi:hypothetical protein